MNGAASPLQQRQSAQRPKDQRAMVAIDLGAESCRVSLLRWVSGVPHIELVHRHPNAAVSRDGELRWNLKRITEQIDEGLRKCAEIATEGIRSIAADGWAVDYVRLNQDGEPIADPFCYRDERTIASQEAVLRLISPERLQQITGTEMIRINTVYQLFADAADLQERAWLNLSEYILFRLGGKLVAEYTNATHTQLVDAQTRDWSTEIFDALHLPRSSAAPIVPPGSVIGRVSADKIGLACLGGAELIAPACHDTASAIAGIPDTGDDWAYISSGTWSLVGTILPKPVLEHEARAANFTNLGTIGGRICFHKNVNGMWLLRQCMAEWAKDIDWAVPELIKAAEQHAFGKAGIPATLLDVDDPDLMLPGEMPRRINRQLERRGFETLEEGAEAAPLMVSLILRSLAARYGEIVRTLAQVTGKHFRRVYIVGGASRNALLNRLTAEATGLEVICGAVESATIGNLAIQLAVLEGRPGSYGVDATQVAHWAMQLVQVSQH
jgi:rhamnulokinase